MSDKMEVEASIRSRIESVLDAFEGKMPEPYALVFYGYLVAAIEWELISPDGYGRLFALLPKLSDNDPVDSAILGKE